MLVIAGGYASTYGSEAGEIAAAKEGKWFPTTIDFRATAASSGGGREAKTFAQFLELIAAEKEGAIQNLGVIGHASSQTFSLSGKITSYPANVVFTEGGMIHPVSLKDKMDTIKGLRNRFGKDAKITLFACNAGVGKTLLEAVSDAFQVCVYGFANEIVWCFRINGKKIGSRGRTYYDGTGIGARPDCTSNSFADDIWAWGPDSKSCSGAKPAAGSK